MRNMFWYFWNRQLNVHQPYSSPDVMLKNQITVMLSYVLILKTETVTSTTLHKLPILILPALIHLSPSDWNLAYLTSKTYS